jgi:predicted nuclease of restriction endonuclease-like (RecB) superfamily
MRQFYLTFQIHHTLCDELSWSHYRLLIKVENEKARQFYMEEAVKSNWSVRQLARQINTFSYERLLASNANYDVVNDTTKKEVNKKPEDIIKDPYVLEFLGLEGNSRFYESDLEQELINRLQKFLLELGRGFSFVSRQQHINFDGRHFHIDLVFYHYILKCFVLIDLKLGDLTHQDIGQMQMYVNYYTKEKMNEGDNPQIGIILCSDKSDTLVKYTLPEGQNQIYASKYMLFIPTEEELRREIILERNNLEKE